MGLWDKIKMIFGIIVFLFGMDESNWAYCSRSLCVLGKGRRHLIEKGVLFLFFVYVYIIF